MQDDTHGIIISLWPRWSQGVWSPRSRHQVLTLENTRLFLNGTLEKNNVSLLGFYFVHLLVLQTNDNFQELAILVFWWKVGRQRPHLRRLSERGDLIHWFQWGHLSFTRGQEVAQFLLQPSDAMCNMPSWGLSKKRAWIVWSLAVTEITTATGITVPINGATAIWPVWSVGLKFPCPWQHFAGWTSGGPAGCCSKLHTTLPPAHTS
jgi:hypothetical protein